MTRGIRLIACPVLFSVLAACENTVLDRCLVFSTHTTFGVEVSASPAETDSPVKLVIGYKRHEGVLNPVFYNHNSSRILKAAAGAPTTANQSKPGGQPPPFTGDVNTYYRPEAYSVLAKFHGGASAATGQAATGNVSVAQWFATGEAAEVLAKQPGIAGAISGSSEIAKEAATEARFSAGLGGQVVTALYDVTGIVEQLPSSTRATIQAKLDAFAEQIEIPADLIFIEGAVTSENRLAIRDATARVKADVEQAGALQGVVNYQQALEDSLENLQSLDLDSIRLLEADNTVGRPLNAMEKRSLQAQIEIHKRALARLYETSEVLAEAMYETWQAMFTTPSRE